MATPKWAAPVSLTLVCVCWGLLLAAQLQTQPSARPRVRNEEWDYVVANLVEGSGRLRDEVAALEEQLTVLQEAEGGGGAVLQSLVDEVNRLRMINGLVEISGPGVEIIITGTLSTLDLHDLINEVRNAGAEGLALSGYRIVAWSAISTDGQNILIDGRPIASPYFLHAIGAPDALEAALTRPGGLVNLLTKTHQGASITVARREKVTLPVCTQLLQFAYARPVQADRQQP